MPNQTNLTKILEATALETVVVAKAAATLTVTETQTLPHPETTTIKVLGNRGGRNGHGGSSQFYQLDQQVYQIQGNGQMPPQGAQPNQNQQQF